ncbi:hypothetical protein [Cellvibrio sp. NN19]|uniref:hypothetical protein n=1 Tax=Cellvibrio chitinivorans TaxID=3102792 RepID=UPI002B40DEF1|nr:hypothetical protein [Cellvibrio sp. NN19]
MLLAPIKNGVGRWLSAGSAAQRLIYSLITKNERLKIGGDCFLCLFLFLDDRISSRNAVFIPYFSESGAKTVFYSKKEIKKEAEIICSANLTGKL